MAQVVAKFPPRSVDNHSFGIPDFEPLLNSHQAAQLLDIHHEAAHSASCKGDWHSQENRMAYFPALLRHIAEGKRRGCQNRPGALTAREQQDHARCLHTSIEHE